MESREDVANYSICLIQNDPLNFIRCIDKHETTHLEEIAHDSDDPKLLDIGRSR
jgi:hypothetical protein